MYLGKDGADFSSLLESLMEEVRCELRIKEWQQYFGTIKADCQIPVNQKQTRNFGLGLESRWGQCWFCARYILLGCKPESSFLQLHKNLAGFH